MEGFNRPKAKQDADSTRIGEGRRQKETTQRRNYMRSSTMTLPARCSKDQLDACKLGLHLSLLTILHRSLVFLEDRCPDGVHVCMSVYVWPDVLLQYIICWKGWREIWSLKHWVVNVKLCLMTWEDFITSLTSL